MQAFKALPVLRSVSCIRPLPPRLLPTRHNTSSRIVTHGTAKRDGSSPPPSHNPMSAETKEAIARERFHKAYDECDSHEKKSVAGVYSGNQRKKNIEEAGGSVHDAYADLAKHKKKDEDAEEREK